MDSITRTARSAVVTYYNTLRRMGTIHKQDKCKLLVLWLFHYLKNNSDFLYRWDKDAKVWKKDKELERTLEKKFRENLPCLAGASCFIKLLPEDECVPLLEIMWGDPNTTDYTLMVTNATDIMETSNSTDVIEMIEAWSNGSGIIGANHKQGGNMLDDAFITNNQ